MKKKSYGAVEDIYSLGKHALLQTVHGEELVSLKELATTSRREIVPSFIVFQRYFTDEFSNSNDAENYGHHLVQRALDGKDFSQASVDERREVVVKTLQYMVTYMAALQDMYDAIDDCESSDTARRNNAPGRWDRSAVLLIGSLEGNYDGGSADGVPTVRS